MRNQNTVAHNSIKRTGERRENERERKRKKEIKRDREKLDSFIM